MKKVISLLVVMGILFSTLTTLMVNAEEVKKDIHGQFGISIDARTGEIHYEKNSKEKAYPASITKMVTAILLDENVKDGEMMKVSEFAAGQEASNLHYKLEKDEEISKEDAMKALMLISSNDVAVTIAEHIAGSQEAFAKMMTEKVKSFGLTNTNFVTASGLHDPNHYTTAYDMAMVGKKIVEDYPNVLEIMGTPTAIVSTTKKKDVEIKNPSKIHENPIALGGKTGYTNAAQNTLVEILEKDGKQVVAVVMKTTLAEEYNDIEIMGEYAFSKMKPYQKMYEKGKIVGQVKVNKFDVDVKINSDLYVQTEKKTDLLNAKTELVVDKKINKNIKEIKKEQEIGTLQVKINGKVVGTEKIYSVKDYKKEEKVKMKEEEKGFNLGKFLISIIVPILIYLSYQYYQNIRNKKKNRRGKNV